MIYPQKTCPICLCHYSKRAKETRRDWQERGTCGEQSCVTEYQRRQRHSRKRDCTCCGRTFTPLIRNMDAVHCHKCRSRTPEEIKAISKYSDGDPPPPDPRDVAQSAIDRECLGAGHTSPFRVLTRQEIAAIAHTITPIEQIPRQRFTGTPAYV